MLISFMTAVVILLSTFIQVIVRRSCRSTSSLAIYLSRSLLTFVAFQKSNRPAIMLAKERYFDHRTQHRLLFFPPRCHGRSVGSPNVQDYSCFLKT